MKQIALTYKGRLPDKEVYFCIYAVKPDREIKVLVTSQVLSGLKKEFKCDLETVARLAIEHTLESGIKGKEVNLAGKTYIAVRKKLKESHC